MCTVFEFSISIFDKFNLRIFNLRVSNPNELIVDVFLTRGRRRQDIVNIHII